MTSKLFKKLKLLPFVILYWCEWKKRKLLLKLRGSNVQQLDDLCGVVFLDGKRIGEKLEYGRQYYKAYFGGWIND